MDPSNTLSDSWNPKSVEKDRIPKNKDPLKSLRTLLLRLSISNIPHPWKKSWTMDPSNTLSDSWNPKSVEKDRIPKNKDPLKSLRTLLLRLSISNIPHPWKKSWRIHPILSPFQPWKDNDGRRKEDHFPKGWPNIDTFVTGESYMSRMSYFFFGGEREATENIQVIRDTEK